MNDQHIKTLNTDKRVKNRLQYASSRQRGKKATADVYRSYKRRIGVASSATREERVHQRFQKRPRTSETGGEGEAVVQDHDSDTEALSESTFGEELDIALDRNGSEIFYQFHRETWHLVRSLPEVLHHAPKIVDLLLSYMLSPASTPGAKSPPEEDSKERLHYEINHATADILHLLAVLARDLRHEIHPYLHTKIIPRILFDLLNPPPLESGKPPVLLDVTVVEAAFRTLSYIFRYDAEPLLTEVEKDGQEPCLECMRKYYGPTLAHRRDLVRRLAAETFAPLIRKLKTDSAKKRHFRRVLRALASSSKPPTTGSAKRVQSDAVDGISLLCFEVVRGVSGRMHSKGSIVVKCVLDCVASKSDANNDTHGQTLVYSVASSFFERLCRHLDRENAMRVFIHLIATTKRTLEQSKEVKSSEGGSQALFHFMKLLDQMAVYRGGDLMNGDDVVASLSDLLELLLDEEGFLNLPETSSTAAVELLCSVWKARSDDNRFASKMSELLRGILKRSYLTEAAREATSEASLDADSTVNILVSKLMPYLPIEIGMNKIGSPILSAAATLTSTDIDRVLTMVHAVAATKAEVAEADDDSDDTFFVQNAIHCELSHSEQETLLSLCVSDDKVIDEKCVARLGVATKCAAFVAMVSNNSDSDNSKSHSIAYRKVSGWLCRLMRIISDHEQYQNEDDEAKSLSVLFSLALESLSRLSLVSFDQRVDRTSIEKAVKKARPLAAQHILAKSSSLWAVKSGAAFVEALQALELTLPDDDDAMFEALIPNLHDCYHFRRLHSLQILSVYPKRPFIVSHDELDLTDDLDEEPSRSETHGSSPKTHGPTGLCNIMDVLLLIESTCLSLSKERYVVNLISRVEVLGRSGRLPVIYADAAASHMLGLFHIKFAPLWPAAVKALVAIAGRHEECAWPPVHAEIAQHMRKIPYREAETDEDLFGARQRTFDPKRHEQLCLDWESSKGANTLLFGTCATVAREQGRISWHQSTEVVVLESLWSVIEGAPQLMMKHSRVLIPIFLEFLHGQYFRMHPHDPDFRELRLHEHVNEERGLSNLDKSMDARVVGKRLMSMLKAFSSVNGPQQLFKHHLLLSIFVSFLGHPDSSIAQVALSCVLRFKPPYLMPYADAVSKFFVKGKLREALLHFKSLVEDGSVGRDHRRLLIPTIARIMLGRLSARAGAKSSKDSPAARRTAILSFFAAICDNDEELYALLYLILRGYIPRDLQTKPIESQRGDDCNAVVHRLASVCPDDCARLPVPVHQGFLNVLEAVVSQLGHRVVSYVPSFVSIVLSLTKLYEVKEQGVQMGSEDLVDEDADSVEKETARASVVRTLCYRRLAELLKHFSRAVDFSAYTENFWRSLHRSLALLPEMAVNSDKVPSLLQLLTTLAGDEKLLMILGRNDKAVKSVLMCLSPTSKRAVVESVLTFIENMMSAGGSGSTDTQSQEHVGYRLVRQHVGLLLQRFQLRFALPAEGPTWRRELDILCQISKLIDRSEDAIQTEATEQLFSVLVPFLALGLKISDDERLNVLDILSAMIPRLTSAVAKSYYSKLSSFLGPNKGKQGLASKKIRLSLASVLESLALYHYDAAARPCGVLVELCAVKEKRVDEPDYDSVLPAISALNDPQSSSSWFGLCKLEEVTEPSILAPIVHCAFHLLYDEDGVISRAALKALKKLVGLSAREGGLVPKQEKKTSNDNQVKWVKLLEGSIVRMTRNGLGTRDPAQRRRFILLLAEIARQCKGAVSPNLYGDLATLVRDDEPDLDFFLNITHVQIHRRAKALQRLRKQLVQDGADQTQCLFCLQTLSNVLLPLAMHPVYESKQKLEEPLALEGIATVGAISRYLSWNKYSNVLWTTLTQFNRHAEQERYLISMICSIIDGFHFEVLIDAQDVRDKTGSQDTVWRALDRRFIPKVEELLVKEKVDRNGERIKVLRPAIVLALLKLFQKLPQQVFERKLPRLLTIICDVLKSKDSDARDIARSTLGKMVVEIDMEFLLDVVRELTVALNEGYRLHVRTATIHTILLEISRVYKPPDLSTQNQRVPLPFDKAVPAFMDLIQQDLFGVAQERKEAKDSRVRYVKEASGSKSANGIELIASMLLFKPSLALGEQHCQTASAVHAVVSPLLERLREADVRASTIRRIRECIARVVAGLSRNRSLVIQEVLPFVYTTVEPFVGKQEIDSVVETIDGGDDEAHSKAIRVSGSAQTGTTSTTNDIKGIVVEWQPSTHKALKSTKAARDEKVREEKEAVRVQDGASAPKLTGSSRYKSPSTPLSTGVNDPASITAVVFGLQLLNSSLRKCGMEDKDIAPMLDPFVPLLTTCLCVCRDSDVVLLSLRCLVLLLRTDLPSFSRCSKSLAVKTLELLVSGGSASNSNQEMLQATFKMLTFLIKFDRKQLGTEEGTRSEAGSAKGEDAMAKGTALPLDAEQMQVLISFLQGSIVDSDQHNPAIGLVKAVMSCRFVSPEFYDLMETLLEQSVRSPKASLRQQSAGIFISYLLDYPMAEERLEQHLKQIVLNLKYEFAEGRLSAIGLAASIVERLPTPILEKYCQLFFLPLTLQLANDDSKECREAIADCLSSLLGKISTDILQSLYEYTERWSQGEQSICRTSLQLYGIFIDTRIDFLKRGDKVEQLMEKLQTFLQDSSDEDWEIQYFALICMEKLAKPFNSQLTGSTDVWLSIVDCLTNDHPWVRLASSRLVSSHLTPLDPQRFLDDGSKTFLAERPGSLYQVARNFCYQLNADEGRQNEDLNALAIKSLTWILRAMRDYPHLCFSTGGDKSGDDRDPVHWVMTRLSNIAKPKGTKRRQAVFKCFAAFATYCIDISSAYLDLMLEPLHRSEIETRNELEAPSLLQKERPVSDSVSEEALLAKDVIHILEERCESHDAFIKAYSSVKTRARDKKEQRKVEITTEAIRDPRAAAKRKIQKQDQEKKRRKRRAEERRQNLGVSVKRRQLT